MRLPHRLQGQKVKNHGHGAGAYCGGHLAAQLVFFVFNAVWALRASGGFRIASDTLVIIIVNLLLLLSASLYFSKRGAY